MGAPPSVIACRLLSYGDTTSRSTPHATLPTRCHRLRLPAQAPRHFAHGRAATRHALMVRHPPSRRGGWSCILRGVVVVAGRTRDVLPLPTWRAANAAGRSWRRHPPLRAPMLAAAASPWCWLPVKREERETESRVCCPPKTPIRQRWRRARRRERAVHHTSCLRNLQIPVRSQTVRKNIEASQGVRLRYIFTSSFTPTVVKPRILFPFFRDTLAWARDFEERCGCREHTLLNCCASWRARGD